MGVFFLNLFVIVRMRYCGMNLLSNKWIYEEFFRILNVKYENKNEVNSLIKSLLKINVSVKYF